MLEKGGKDLRDEVERRERKPSSLSWLTPPYKILDPPLHCDVSCSSARSRCGINVCAKRPPSPLIDNI